MAEALLRRRLALSGAEAMVSSAGFVLGGRPATKNAIATMAARGLDISHHRSRIVTDDMASAVDLIVTMTGQHVAELAAIAPATWTKAFALRDLVRRADTAGRRHPDEDEAAWVGRLADGRGPRDVLIGNSGDDIADPIGKPRAAYERTADQLDELLGRLTLAIT